MRVWPLILAGSAGLLLGCTPPNHAPDPLAVDQRTCAAQAEGLGTWQVVRGTGFTICLPPQWRRESRSSLFGKSTGWKGPEGSLYWQSGPFGEDTGSERDPVIGDATFGPDYSGEPFERTVLAGREAHVIVQNDGLTRYVEWRGLQLWARAASQESLNLMQVVVRSLRFTDSASHTLAQALEALRQGTKFRIITTESRYRYGRYHGLSGDTLLLAEWWDEGGLPQADRGTLRVPLQTIQFLDYSLGSGASKGLILGAGIGTGTGLLLGFVAGGSGEPSRGELAVGGAVVLLPVGMVVGALIGSGSNEWHPLPIH